MKLQMFTTKTELDNSIDNFMIINNLIQNPMKTKKLFSVTFICFLMMLILSSGISAQENREIRKVNSFKAIEAGSIFNIVGGNFN
jgi:hypothetical protein